MNKKQFPNILSFSRLPLAFLIVFLCSKGAYGSAFLCSILAGLTDLWDGKLARKFQTASHFGSVLDPMMDKCYLLVLTFFLFFHLQATGNPWFTLFAIWFVVTWVRNICQLVAVPILNFAKISFKVQPKPFAKWGTVFNLIVLSYILFGLAVGQLGDEGGINYNSDIFSIQLFTTAIGSTLITFVYHYTYFSILLFLFPSFLFEFWILVTFVPRFFQILTGKHDTFT